MKSFGSTLVLLAIAFVVLPKLGWHPAIAVPLEPHQPWASVGIGAIGAILYAAGWRLGAAKKPDGKPPEPPKG
jgi:hypothetical protein